MDVRIVISVPAAHTPFKGHDVPVALSRTNISPLSYASFRDHDLVNDLRQFAAFHGLSLDTTYLTSNLLYLLLDYQATCTLDMDSTCLTAKNGCAADFGLNKVSVDRCSDSLLLLNFNQLMSLATLLASSGPLS